MPEHLRALFVILALASAVFVFAKAPACASASMAKDFVRRRNLWFAITLIAFLAHNYWIYIVLAAVFLLLTGPWEPNKLAMYFLLLFAVPAFPSEVTGLGLVRYFFDIDYLRLLALTVLLPAFVTLWNRPDSERFGKSAADKFLAGYLILQFLLILKGSTFTNTLRSGLFYSFIDVFLPYYVASRSLKNLQGFRDALMGFVIAALILALIGAFEFSRNWILYRALGNVLGGDAWGYLNYQDRGQGSLRAVGTAGQPIPFGYVMAVAGGFMLYFRRLVPSQFAWSCALALLMAGLIASLSRGPWVGAAVILIVFIGLGPAPGKNYVILALLGLVAAPALLLSPVGQKIIDLLPFVGTVEADTVVYRQEFTKAAISYILQHPFFGGYDYFYSPEMDSLKRNNFLDILNTFLAVGLGSGLVGMFFFTGVFGAIAIGLFKSLRRQIDRSGELYLLGRSLFSTLVGIMLILCTVSSITVIPIIYWSVLGIGTAYIRMLALAKPPEAELQAHSKRETMRAGSYAGIGAARLTR